MIRMRHGHDSGGRTWFNDSLGSQRISEDSGDAKCGVFIILPHDQPGAAPPNEPRTGPFRTKRIESHRGSTRSPNEPRLLLVPTVLRGNAVLAAPRPLCRPDPTT